MIRRKSHVIDLACASVALALLLGCGAPITSEVDHVPDVVAILSSGTTNRLNAVFFIDQNTGLVVGDSGTILKTTNGRNAWTALSVSNLGGLRDVFFVDSDTGTFAVQTGYLRLGMEEAHGLG
jgi:hypothetical protein